MERNLRLYPWYQAARNLLFWQGVWFLYFEQVLSAQEAILLAAAFDLGTVLLEVPSGYLSDAVGRRVTLLISAITAVASYLLFFAGGSFAIFFVAQMLWSVAISFNSGTDSALLFDSLKSLDRTQDTAALEAKAWRYTYMGLAVSAATGGLMASGVSEGAFALTYLLTAGAGLAALWIVYQFTEPPRTDASSSAQAPLAQFTLVLSRLNDPVLRWMFVFMISVYILSHVPFVFVQPYLRDLLGGFGLQHETPAVAGGIVAIMMALSALVGWRVLRLRARFGTRMMFAVALVLQTGLIAAMAWVVHPLIIGFIILRMVPGALTRPFFLEAIHPRLESGYRATYLSVQSLVARLMFSTTLFLVAAGIAGADRLTRSEMTAVLPWFVLGGAVIAAALIWTWPRDLQDGKPAALD